MTLLKVYSKTIGLNNDDLFELENGDFKIKFIDDFLFMDTSLFQKFRKINPSKLIKARELFFNKYTSKLEKLSLESLNSYLSTGIQGLDDFLNGGFPLNRVIELRGDESSGKTLFCFNIILNLVKNEMKVLYIDTDLCSRSNTFLELIKDRATDNELLISLLKEKLDICILENYQELIFKLNRLYQSQINGQTNYQFLIIDSVFLLLATECLISNTNESKELMNEKFSLIINLVSKLLTTSVTILTTNTKLNILPKLWSNRCDLILELEKEEINLIYFYHLKIKKAFDGIKNSAIEDFVQENNQAGNSSPNIVFIDDNEENQDNYLDDALDHNRIKPSNTQDTNESDRPKFTYKLTDTGSIKID